MFYTQEGVGTGVSAMLVFVAPTEVVIHMLWHLSLGCHSLYPTYLCSGEEHGSGKGSSSRSGASKSLWA